MTVFFAAAFLPATFFGTTVFGLETARFAATPFFSTAWLYWRIAVATVMPWWRGCGTAHDPSNLLGELVDCARWSETDVTHMEINVEVRVLDPVGTVEFKRYLDYFAAERLKVTGHDAQPISHLSERVEIS